jgi:hypothetical protein
LGSTFRLANGSRVSSTLNSSAWPHRSPPNRFDASELSGAGGAGTRAEPGQAARGSGGQGNQGHEANAVRGPESSENGTSRDEEQPSPQQRGGGRSEPPYTEPLT